MSAGQRVLALAGAGFNRAAPFRERLSAASSSAANRRPGFNRAAPFRERLWLLGMAMGAMLFALQSCRPLSGAVI